MVLSEEEIAFMEKEGRELALAEQQAASGHAQQDAQASMLREQERNVIKEQLSLGDELTTIENLLRGRILKENEHGGRNWIDAPSEEMQILTEHGVHLIMNTILFYLNKNTLLSNYETEIIAQKMEDFATDLTDTIFMEYEKVFKYPTLEDCKNVLMQRIEKKKELRKFAYKLMGKEVDDEEIVGEFIHEIENKIESELEKIREQIVKNKLKRFLIIIREVQDFVHSAYLRAWNGQERRTLRQHIHVTESLGGMGNYQQQTQKKKSFWRRG